LASGPRAPSGTKRGEDRAVVAAAQLIGEIDQVLRQLPCRAAFLVEYLLQRVPRDVSVQAVAGDYQPVARGKLHSVRAWLDVRPLAEGLRHLVPRRMRQRL